MSQPVPPADLATIDAATALFARALSGGLDGDCSACPGWSRRDCANHVLGGGLRYAGYFVPLSQDEVAWTRTTDHAGDDPVTALTETSSGLRERFATAPDAEALVPHRFMDMPVIDLVVLRVFELVVHAHDLDPSSWTGDTADEAERLAGWLLSRGAHVVESMRGFDVVDASTESPADADARTRLLALAGRHPGT